MGEKRNGIFVGKPEGRRPLGRPKRRWVDNIKMDLREIGLDGVDWSMKCWEVLHLEVGQKNMEMELLSIPLRTFHVPSFLCC
jgi:hypothetical protein